MEEIKQIIVIRKDLKMRRGKECAQASHASGLWMAEKLLSGCTSLREVERVWLSGNFTKIVCQVESEAELLAVFEKACEVNLLCRLITDIGATEFKEPTKTCCAIGPEYASAFIGVTDTLRLY